MYTEIMTNIKILEAHLKKNIWISLALCALISSVGATSIMSGSQGIMTHKIVFQDVNNPSFGMTLDTNSHTFEIRNPSGTISTGTYIEHPDYYVVIYDGGLSQNVKKFDGGVYGGDGEIWKRV